MPAWNGDDSVSGCGFLSLTRAVPAVIESIVK